MPYVYFNNNPREQRVDDFTVRAVSKVLEKDWEESYLGLCAEGLIYSDVPTSSYVMGMLLRKYGFIQENVGSICPQCISVSQFSEEYPDGKYVLVCKDRIIPCINGDYFDYYDSGEETVLYYFEKEF